MARTAGGCWITHGKFVLIFVADSRHAIMVRRLSLWSLRGLGTGFGRHGAAVQRSHWPRGLGTASSGHDRSPPGWRGLTRRWRRTGEGGQPGAGRGTTLSVIFRKSRSRLGFLARLRMVSATASSRPLMRPMAKRRSRVMFSGPWSERIRLRSSSKLQSRMWCIASTVQCPRLRVSRRSGDAACGVRLVTA